MVGADFLEKEFKALARQIMDVVEIAFIQEKQKDEARFKLARKKILDAVNDTKRHLLKQIKGEVNEGKGV